MIGYISGEVKENNISNVILLVNGIGYKIFIAPNTNAVVGHKIDLWTYLAVRENSLDLYGFNSVKEKDFFELLLTISGIGPKTAMGILSVASVEDLSQAVASGDTSKLIKVSGIGRKTAQKIALELKDKIEESESNVSGISSSDLDVFEALRALGYTESQARDALSSVDQSVNETSQKVKEALKFLNK